MQSYCWQKASELHRTMVFLLRSFLCCLVRYSTVVHMNPYQHAQLFVLLQCCVSSCCVKSCFTLNASGQWSHRNFSPLWSRTWATRWAFLCKYHGAQLTLKWLLTRVSTGVYDKAALFSKAPVALVAAVRTVTRVLAAMYHEVVFLFKGAPTVAAAVWTVISVLPKVFNETVLSCKAHATIVTMMWTFASVGAEMPQQPASERKILAAIAAFVHLLARVFTLIILSLVCTNSCHAVSHEVSFTMQALSWTSITLMCGDQGICLSMFQWFGCARHKPMVRAWTPDIQTTGSGLWMLAVAHLKAVSSWSLQSLAGWSCTAQFGSSSPRKFFL